MYGLDLAPPPVGIRDEHRKALRISSVAAPRESCNTELQSATSEEMNAQALKLRDFIRYFKTGEIDSEIQKSVNKRAVNTPRPKPKASGRQTRPSA